MILFQEILTFTVNNFNPQPDYPLLQSMLKLFYLFKLQVQFYGDKLSEVLIQCNFCNKYFCCHISDIIQGNFTKKQILPIFIKSVVFFHVGLSWMIVRNRVSM